MCPLRSASLAHATFLTTALSEETVRVKHFNVLVKKNNKIKIILADFIPPSLISLLNQPERLCMLGSQIVALVLWFHYELGPVRLDRMIGDIELICFKSIFLLKFNMHLLRLLYFLFHQQKCIILKLTFHPSSFRPKPEPDFQQSHSAMGIAVATVMVWFVRCCSSAYTALIVARAHLETVETHFG